MQKTQKTPLWLRLLLGACILILLILLGGRLVFRLPVRAYYSASQKAFPIPGLSSGLVPQGIAYAQEEDLLLVTGYQADHSATPVYILERASGRSISHALLTMPDGSDSLIHAGGLSVHGNTIYVAGGEDGCLFVYDLQDALHAEGGRIPCKGVFPLTLSASDSVIAAFTAVQDGMLTVGEFYREPNYLTPDTHHFSAANGERFRALALNYAFDESDEGLFGLSKQPVSAYALPNLVQGMAFRNGEIWLSTSYGAAFSTLYGYDEGLLSPALSLEVGGAAIPLYALASEAQFASIQIPPMSEEILFLEDRLFTMCESASNKYLFGNLTGGRWCYATDIDRLLHR